MSGRANPNELLARAREEEARAGRGRLKIFFGAAPGVGKTFAMLNAAQRLAREGVDVVIGLVETHGRAETEQQLLGLDILPRRPVEYKGTTLAEFDLDAALARRPEVLVLDEFAHSNAPGSRFEKRWQDVEELLAAGISVYTSLNVQHIESLNDVVSQITGVQVRETVPDSALEKADEIELIDLPPDVLLERLKAGKVYVPDSIAPALDSFFRRGNLTALRELALRRTAEWVDGQMRRYRETNSIRAVWPAAERILVAVSPSPASSRIVRAAKRMAAGLHADLIAAYVETPRTSRLRARDQDRVTETLRLAETLGASTTTLSADNAAIELVAFARSRNVSKIVVGKTWRPLWKESLFGSFVGSLIRISGDIDVYVIRGDSDAPDEEHISAEPAVRRSGAMAYAGALGLVLVATLIGRVLPPTFDAANLSMIYLAGVIVAAVWLGRGPAVTAAILGVAAFDFFFVPPALTFRITDAQYLVTFAVMLCVGLLIANLTTRLRDLLESSRTRERRTALSYDMVRGLAVASNREQVASVAVKHVHDTFSSDVSLLVPAGNQPAAPLESLASAGSPDWIDERECGVARWSFDHAKPAGTGTRTLPASAGRYTPLLTPRAKLGVLACRATSPSATASQLLLLDTFANHIALALERVDLIEAQQAAKLEAESERLRGSLLRSVSHDLRTPLAAISGAAGTLLTSNLEQAARIDLTQSIAHEADRLSELIANLMFATRLEAGVSLRREWMSLEEIVGSGLARHREALASRPCRIHLPDDFPLLRVDNAMLPQVIHNLIDNALRYTPRGTPIEIAAWTTDSQAVVRVADEGLGLADRDHTRIFERFYRGAEKRPNRASVDAKPQAESHPSSGLGLGLTICEGIVKAHGGRIWAEPNQPRGTAFLFTLPIERPQPIVTPESDLAEPKAPDGEAA
ncbi:MAG: sensor histidine kinase KdpD [Phycisphaerales bacterium]|nr:sensor histidine kinase KdpD [Phycisphaerales bacterium]